MARKSIIARERKRERFFRR